MNSPTPDRAGPHPDLRPQVVGVNNNGVTVGFWVDINGNNFGFERHNGRYTSVKNPNTTGTTNQLLGVNDHGIAVGFYTDAAGNAHGYTYNIFTGHIDKVLLPSGVNPSAVTPTGITNNGDISGFYTLHPRNLHLRLPGDVPRQIPQAVLRRWHQHPGPGNQPVRPGRRLLRGRTEQHTRIRLVQRQPLGHDR